MPAKDVENERRAVDDLDRVAKHLLEVRLLRGGELVIKHDDVDVHPPHDVRKLPRLSRAHERLGHRRVKPLRLPCHDNAVRRLHEARKLVHRGLKWPV